MTLVPIELPPGYSRQGTLYQTKGRWYGGTFVRWYQGSMQPIGGWRKRYATTISDLLTQDGSFLLTEDGDNILLESSDEVLAGVPRAIHAWRSDDLTRFLAIGTNSKLYAATVTMTAMADITPAGFISGRADASAVGGYGGGAYGVGAYGTATADSSAIQDADMWTLDNFGQYLVGCMAGDGVAYEWTLDASTPTPAAAISGAPTGNSALVTTPENFLMLLCAGGDPRKLQWCDQGDETTWTPTATNQAGDFNIQSNGRLMCGVRARSQTLIFTDQDVFQASYIGLPFVYNFTRVGESCGAISRGCVAAVDARAFWWSLSGFFAWDGASVSPMACDVYDATIGNLNVVQRSKVVAGVNSQFSEVWWAFPSSASIENDTVVTFNYLENHWELHSIIRTAIADRGVFTYPIMCSADGNVYEHEVGTAWDSVPYAVSGPQEIGDGDNIMRVSRVIFDEKTQGDVQLTVYTSDWPNGTETTNGPYTSGNPVSVRFAGRQARQKVEFQDQGQWGAPRFEVIVGSKR